MNTFIISRFHPVGLLYIVLAIVLANVAPASADPVPGEFMPVADLAANRWSPATVLLQDGRVFLAGGAWIAGYGLRDAEIFDPVTATWSQTGEMGLPRFGHAMAALNDGRVIVFGGVAGTDCATSTFSSVTEIWDPTTGVFTSSQTMNTLVPRVAPAVATLSDGRVLAAGGWDRCGTVYSSAEIFDPASGIWTATGDMNIARHAAASLLLPDGRVLVAGGIGGDPSPSLDSAEIYDPATGTWSLTGSMLNTRYWGGDDHVSQGDLIPLADGRILTAGGISRDCNNWYTCSSIYLDGAETYDPTTGTWGTTGSMTTPRGAHRVVRLGDGTVLAIGGYNGTNTLSTAEIYDPVTALWAPTAEMVVARSNAAAVSLLDGSALIAAGYSCCQDLASTEIFSLGGPLNRVTNAGFESGSGIAWTEVSNNNLSLITRTRPRTSEFSAQLGSRDNALDYVQQTVKIPTNGRLTYWSYMTSTDTTTQGNDFLTVALYRTNGQLLRTLRTTSNTSLRDRWVRTVIDVSRLAGRTASLRFSASTNGSLPTYFYIDDITLK